MKAEATSRGPEGDTQERSPPNYALSNRLMAGKGSLDGSKSAPFTPVEAATVVQVGKGDELEEAKIEWVHRAAKRIPCLGIMFSLGSSLFLGTAGMLVKVTQSVHGVQISVFRASIQVIVYSIIIGVRGVKLRPAPGEWWAIFGRAFPGAVSITCSYFALKLAPLGDVTVIRFSMPIWTLIMGYFALGETCSLLKTSAVVVSLTGVALIAKPEECINVIRLIGNALHITSPVTDEFEPEQSSVSVAGLDDAAEDTGLAFPPVAPQSDTQLQGCLLALLASVCLATSIVCLRLCKSTPVEVIVLWLSIFSLTVGAVLLTILGEWHMPNSLQDVLLIILNGLCGVIGQWFMSNALKVEQSGVISLARTVDIQVAFMYSAFLLHETIHASNIIGAVLVSYGTIAVVMPKLLESRSKLKKKQPAVNLEMSETSGELQAKA